MNFNELKELISIIDNSSLTKFETDFENTSIKMSKLENSNNSNVSVKNKAFRDFKNSQSENIRTETTTNENNKSETQNTTNTQTNMSLEPITIMPTQTNTIKAGNIISSPLVGTFYQSSSPDKPAFVSVGSKVKVGDVLCIVEAMKIMNEITSKFDGEIAEIMVENESLVEFGQPLFRIV